MPWEKQFDRADALHRAQRVFWKTGYEKSSLNILLKGMGIQRGSFYATFGSKHKVLVEALYLYIQERFDSFLALKAGVPPLTALRRHLDEVLRESIGPDRFMRSFLVNCATERTPEGSRRPRDRVDDAARARTLLRITSRGGESAGDARSGCRHRRHGLGAARTRTGHAGLRERRGALAETLRALRHQMEGLIA